MRLTRLAASVCLLALLLVGCVRSKAPPFPDHPGYLLVGRMIHKLLETNRLVIFDADTLTVWREVKLPPSAAYEMSMDPRGRIWIGFVGDFDRADRRVMVFAPDGS